MKVLNFIPKLFIKYFLKWIYGLMIFSFVISIISFFQPSTGIQTVSFQAFIDSEYLYLGITFALFFIICGLISFPVPIIKYILVTKALKENYDIGITRLALNVFIGMMLILPLVIWYVFGFPINNLYQTTVIPFYLFVMLMFNVKLR